MEVLQTAWDFFQNEVLGMKWLQENFLTANAGHTTPNRQNMTRFC